MERDVKAAATSMEHSRHITEDLSERISLNAPRYSPRPGAFPDRGSEAGIPIYPATSPSTPKGTT
jgi:hypothetical protein